MQKQTILAGYTLVLAAITFWISWFLMPDPGTTDTNHILHIVKQSRSAVLISVTTQISSSILFIVVLFLLTPVIVPQKKTLAGFILLGVGAMGMCSDAFFHLLAYFMTDDSINIQRDVVHVMTFMQTKGVAFLIPILLPFFIGTLLLAINLNKLGIVSRTPKLLCKAALLIAAAGAVAGKTQIYNGPVTMLTVLGLFAAGQIRVGFELIKKSGKESTRMETSGLRMLTRE